MKKVRISLEEIEWRIVFNALNDLRTKLIEEGRHSDSVEDIMIKIANTSAIKIK